MHDGHVLNGVKKLGFRAIHAKSPHLSTCHVFSPRRRRGAQPEGTRIEGGESRTDNGTPEVEGRGGETNWCERAVRAWGASEGSTEDAAGLVQDPDLHQGLVSCAKQSPLKVVYILLANKQKYSRHRCRRFLFICRTSKPRTHAGVFQVSNNKKASTPVTTLLGSIHPVNIDDSLSCADPFAPSAHAYPGCLETERKKKLTSCNGLLGVYRKGTGKHAL